MVTQCIKEINTIVRDIIIEAPHYGLILSSVNRYVAPVSENSGIEVSTAGVYKKGINQFMVINPVFWTQFLQNKKEKKFVLLHELLHICFNHPIMGTKYSNKELFNIAADIEINQHVMKVNNTTMPSLVPGMTLDAFNLNEQRHREQGTNYYYQLLKKEMEKESSAGKKCKQICDAMRGQGMGGDGSSNDDQGNRNGEGDGIPEYDNHPTWREFNGLSESEKRLVEAQTGKQIAKAVSMNSKAIGNLPGYLREMIEEILNPKPTYNWKKIFRRLYTGYADTTYLKKSRKRESIRFPGMPAIKIKRHSRVLVAVDTSGSISSDELIEFFTEIEGMRRSGVEIIVAECDTHIPKEGIYKYRNLNTIKNRNITGGGGTSFEEPIRYLNEKANRFNMLIYFTDGWASIPKTKSVKPVVWVLSRRGKNLEDFTNYPGFTIKIKDA